MRERSTLLDTSDAISSHSSNPQEVSNHRLGMVREHILRSWYQPVCGSVWSEHKVFERLRNLSLVPEQQSSVHRGVRVNQGALSNSRSQQPFNAMCKRLIYSININDQAATILMPNGDFIVDHHLDIKQATATAAQGAFLPVRERDLFQLDPQNLVMPELDPAYQGLLFPELSLQDLDL